MHVFKNLSWLIFVGLLIACSPKPMPILDLQTETRKPQGNEKRTEQTVYENTILSEFYINKSNQQFTSDHSDRIEMFQADRMYRKLSDNEPFKEVITEHSKNIIDLDNNPTAVESDVSEQPQAEISQPEPQKDLSVEPVPESNALQEPQEIFPADQVIETQTPVAPQELFEPSRVMDLGNSGMEFATMDEADIWAGSQMLNPESPWSGRNGWSGWFTISVAYQVDASGGIDNNYSYTVDFYK